jgi:plastocyanin
VRAKSAGRRFGVRDGLGTTAIALIVIVIIVVGVGSYYYSTTGGGSNSTSSSLSSASTSSTSSSTTSMSNPAIPVEVDMVLDAHLQSSPDHFVPQNVTVELGVNNTVVWINQDTVPHTVTSDTNVFKSGSIGPGANFTWTFTVAGIYHYHCSIHPFMTGTVIVLNAAGQMVSSTISNTSTTSSNTTTSSVATTTSQNTTSSCSYTYGGHCY